MMRRLEGGRRADRPAGGTTPHRPPSWSRSSTRPARPTHHPIRRAHSKSARRHPRRRARTTRRRRARRSGVRRPRGTCHRRRRHCRSGAPRRRERSHNRPCPRPRGIGPCRGRGAKSAGTIRCTTRRPGAAPARLATRRVGTTAGCDRAHFDVLLCYVCGEVGRRARAACLRGGVRAAQRPDVEVT